MTNFSQNNFEGIKESYADIFAALERTFGHFGIDFYLIGAQSRDVWTNHLPLVKRTTRDIDFAVLISDRAEWEAVVFLDDPPTTLSVYGCREVTKDAVLIAGKYHVVTQSGLCIMKLISFDEKPGERARD